MILLTKQCKKYTLIQSLMELCLTVYGLYLQQLRELQISEHFSLLLQSVALS